MVCLSSDRMFLFHIFFHFLSTNDLTYLFLQMGVILKILISGYHDLIGISLKMDLMHIKYFKKKGL